MAIDLLFLLTRRTASPIHLVFGETSSAPLVGVSVDADMGGLSFDALVLSLMIARIAADFGQLQFRALASQAVPVLNDLLFSQVPLTAPPVDLRFETAH